MKKISLILTALIFSSSLAFAQLYPPKRVFEVGTELTFSASQNAVNVTDIFVENLVLDFTKIADGLNGNGLLFDIDADTDFFMNLNLGKRWGVGVFMDANTSLEFGIGQGLWDFLAYGNWDEATNTPQDTKFDLSLSLESFLEFGAPIKFGLKSLGIKVTPSYYIPLAYIPYTSANVIVSPGNASNGKTLTATGEANFNLYTPVSLNGILSVDENGSLNFDSESLSAMFSDLTSNVGTTSMELLQNGGISLGISADYPLFRTLTVGAYADFPLSPGKLSYRTSGTITGTAEVNGILDTATSSSSSSGSSSGASSGTSGTSASGETSSGASGASETSSGETGASSGFYKYDYTFSGISYTELEEAYSVRKPLRFGGEVAWRPFGDWFTIRGMLGYAARNPFGEDWNWKNSMFMEYSGGVDISLFYILRLYAQTSYINKIYAQQFGVGLNLRALELTAKIASSGTSFEQSFGIGGAKVFVGITTGF